MPSPVAPRINVRWTDSITDAARAGVEHRFTLYAGERREGTTWSYDLGNASRANIQALLAHPAVADTHYLDRATSTVSADAPRGTTFITENPLRRWRDSRTADWLVR